MNMYISRFTQHILKSYIDMPNRYTYLMNTSWKHFQIFAQQNLINTLLPIAYLQLSKNRTT